MPYFDTYFLCEQMHDIMEKAKARLSGMDFSGSVHYIENALWNGETSLSFDPHGSASREARPGNVLPMAARWHHLDQGKKVTLFMVVCDARKEMHS